MYAYHRLRGSDGGFIEQTIKIRLAEIVEQTIKINIGKTDLNLGALKESILKPLLDGSMRVEKIPCEACGNPEWISRWNSWLREFLGVSWMEAPWFVVENLLYFLICSKVRYFEHGIDPFAPLKAMALETACQSLPSAALGECHRVLKEGTISDSQFSASVLGSLWGNLADLSMSGGKVAEESVGGGGGQEERILSNDTALAWKVLTKNPAGTVILATDNCGAELLADLVLAASLLGGNLCRRIVLHTKVHPTFVSDVTPADVFETLKRLDAVEQAAPVVEFLRKQQQEERFFVQSDFYYNGPLAAFEAPEHIVAAYKESSLLILKGDANYRRITGDMSWPVQTPFSECIKYFPSPVLALRTCKSNVAVGVAEEVQARVEAIDPQWMVSGKWGLVQCKEK